MSDLRQIIKEKVEGVIVPEYTEDGHFYRFPDGTLQPSVTTKLKIINKPHLLRWAIKKGIEYLEEQDRFSMLKDPATRNTAMVGAYEAHTVIRDDAGDVGHDAHEAVEKYIQDWMDTGNKPQDIREYFDMYADPRAIASARATERLLNKFDIQPVAVEISVGDVRYSAGKLDFLCLWDGKLTLADFKTSNQVDDNYALQVAAYKYFFEHMTGIKIQQTKILHLSKDYDKYTIYKVNNLPQAYKAFKGVVAAFDWIYNGKTKLSKDIKKKVI